MIKDSADITDEEIEKYYVPFDNNFSDFMISFVVPKVFAFQLANSHSRGCFYDASLLQNYHTMCDVFNGFHDSLDSVSKATKKYCVLNII